MQGGAKPISVSLFASEMTSASGHFGLYDVLSSVGVSWEAFVTGEPAMPRFKVQIVAVNDKPFRCASGTLLTPDASLYQVGKTDIVVFPGIVASASQPLVLPLLAAIEASSWIDSNFHSMFFKILGYLLAGGLIALFSIFLASLTLGLWPKRPGGAE